MDEPGRTAAARPGADPGDRSACQAPISDYGAIGDCHGIALVSRDGSIDWCTIGRFDADPVFCRILDSTKGGYLAVAPVGSSFRHRAYLPGTNMLRSEAVTDAGALIVTDFMVVGRASHAGVYDYVSLRAPGMLIRRIECVRGQVSIDAVYRPSVDFARRPADLREEAGGYAADGAPMLYCDLALQSTGGALQGRVQLREGDVRHIVVTASALPDWRERVDGYFATTRAFWEEWSGFCRYRGVHRDAVLRSALALKLLTYAPTGAIVAAPTTSLPETLHGERNWDYRFCWVRDASLTLYALASLGYSGEARRFFTFLQRSCKATHPDIQLMYGIGGETALSERRLDHLDGYCGSRPVRVGNAAHEQRQLDVYGHVEDAAMVYRELGGRPSDDAMAMLAGFVDRIAGKWDEPDLGIWEVRSAPRHFVHSKLMCWLAVDRAIRLFGARPGWTSLRTAIESDILAKGTDPDGALQRAYDDASGDAALLLLSSMAFPGPPGLLPATVQKLERELRDGDFVRRYVTEDGLDGREGSFLVCSFWLVDALLAVDRETEARSLFEHLVAHSSDLGLYAEEIDAQTGAFLGNFPQAFTHLGLIGSAINLQLREQYGSDIVRASYAARAKRAVTATFGWRGLLASFLGTGRRPRLFSSKRSKLSDRQP